MRNERSSSMKEQRRVMIFAGIFVAIVVIIIGALNSSDGKLVSPQLSLLQFNQSAVPASELSEVPAYDPPKEIKYDSSTDLQAELESITPQILDSDFTQLKALIKQL